MNDTNFEQALDQLEEVVKTLERGDIPLKEALDTFERGVSLSKSCHETLNRAEKRVEELMTSFNSPEHSNTESSDEE